MTTEALASTSERQRCRATRKDGQPCTAFAIKNGLCVGHSPEAEEGRRLGGLHSAKRIRAEKALPLRLNPILTLLEQVIWEVHEGKIDIKRAQVMGSLGASIAKIYETSIVEGKLQNLEQHKDGQLTTEVDDDIRRKLAERLDTIAAGRRAAENTGEPQQPGGSATSMELAILGPRQSATP